MSRCRQCWTCFLIATLKPIAICAGDERYATHGSRPGPPLCKCTSQFSEAGCGASMRQDEVALASRPDGAAGGASRLPTFFIVGAPKAGTTSLYYHMRSHPDVYMS